MRHGVDKDVDADRVRRSRKLVEVARVQQLTDHRRQQVGMEVARDALHHHFDGVDRRLRRAAEVQRVRARERFACGRERKALLDRLEIDGSIRISGLARKPDSGGWTVVSDERLKRNVAPITGALRQLLRLRGVRFEWKDANRVANVSGPQIGLVAQDVEKVFPQWVSTDPDGYRELTVRGFEALVIEALRELAKDLEDLRSRLPAAKPSGPKRKKTDQ